MPLTTEFLLMSFLSFALLFVLTGAIFAQIESARIIARNTEHIALAESTALALDMALNGGVSVEFPDDFSVEQHRLHMTHRGKIIEVGGVFEIDSTDPV